MNKHFHFLTGALSPVVLALVLGISGASSTKAQDFDFAHLEKKMHAYCVVMKIHVELSFGMQVDEQEQRLLGTIVTDDGLIIFDGSFLSNDNPFGAMSGFSFRSTPTKIEVVTLDEEQYEAEFVGLDRNTGLGFAQITDAEQKFSPVKFVRRDRFVTGRWLSLFALLPEFVQPGMLADVGMIAAIVEAPEPFTLTVGFSSLEIGSVLFDEEGEAVGILGELSNPGSSMAGGGDMMSQFSQPSVPLLGVIVSERLEKLIAKPPRKGRTDRSWLGITLQALTGDIAEFLSIDASGGIIVNEVVPGSPAYRSGLEVGDVIWGMNGQPIEVDREEELPVFQRQISNMGPGNAVEFSVFRPSGDKPEALTLSAVLEEAPLAADEAEDYESEHLEFKARELVFGDYIHFNLDQSSLKGVLVSEITPGGSASIGGLHLGDIIQRVDGNDIESVSDFEESLTLVVEQQQEEIIFFVWRFSQTLFVNVKTDLN